MKEQIAEFTTGLLRRTAFLRSGIGLTMVAAASVGLRLLWIHLHLPAHRQEITAALGPARMFYGDLQMNRDGSKFIYKATSDIGYGLFIHDSITGLTKEICDEPGRGSDYSYSDINAWPWAPDDSVYVYTFHDKLVIQPSDDTTAPAELIVGTDMVTALAWLNPGLFAFISAKTNLCYAQKQPDGRWEQHTSLHEDEMTSLTAAGTDKVAWLEDGLICRIDPIRGLAGTSNLPSAAPDADANTNAIPPTDGLKLWLDASTLHWRDQSSVPILCDLSPSKNDAIQAGRPPVFNGPESSRALNGKGTIHFTSGDSLAEATGLRTRANLGINNNKPRTVFMVMHHDTGKVMQISTGEPGRRFSFFGLEEADRFFYLPRVRNNWANRIIVRSPDWNLAEVICDGTNENAYVNGLLMGTKDYLLATVDKAVEIGCQTGGTNGTNIAGSDGDFAELLIYNRALDANERRNVENYLKTKWLGNKLLASKGPLIWYNPAIPGLASFSYSRETGRFLFRQTVKGKDSLWRFDPQTDDLSQIVEADAINSAQWVGKDGWACTKLDHGTNAIMLADVLNGQGAPLFAYGEVNKFQAAGDGSKLLIFGTFSNEPVVGIWEYDMAAGRLRSLVSALDHPSVYAQTIIPVRSTFKLANGRNVECLIFPPANLNPHKKYPLLIGDTFIDSKDNGRLGTLWTTDIALANSGAYVAIVNRKYWRIGIENWGDNVLGVYKSMAQNPRIDTSQVFLFCVSPETDYMSDFETNSTGLWKGIILLNPIDLPDFSNSPRFHQRPKILISAGSEDNEEALLKIYQEESLKNGVMVEYIIHPGEGHYIVGNAGHLERDKAMMHFIFEE